MRGRSGTRVVGIGAHPDDIEIGAGGTLARHVDRGDQVDVILCTLGGVSGDPHERKIEARDAVGVLGVKDIHFLDYPVAKLNRPSAQFAKVIKDLLDGIAPDRVYVHSPEDHHQVHVAVSESVWTAARKVRQVLFYETISSTTLDFHPNAFCEITNYIDAKIKSIEAHRSQSSSRFYLQPNVIRSLANVRYVWGKVGANPEGLAEAFRIGRLVF